MSLRGKASGQRGVFPPQLAPPDLTWPIRLRCGAVRGIRTYKHVVGCVRRGSGRDQRLVKVDLICV